MSKVHITLVGGQAAPVYNGIIYSKPDKVVLIYSDESREQANRIQAEIQIPVEMRKMDPVNLEEIAIKVAQCADRYKDDEISINISSGTKPWTYYFIKTFDIMPNAMLFYVDQNNDVWDFQDQSSQRINFDIDTHFRLYGNPLLRFKLLSSYTDTDFSAINQIEQIRASHSTDFHKLTDLLNNHPDQVEQIITQTGSYIKWDKPKKSFEFFFRRNNGKTFEYVLSSPNIRSILCNTKWFELKIARMIVKWDKCKEIRLNCEFPAKSNAPKNEADIIVNTGTKLLFVECKTQIAKINDIDKFNSVVRNYGGMSSKALFITDAPMTNIAKEKCGEYNMITFSLQDQHLGLDDEQALFMILDQELFNINTK